MADCFDWRNFSCDLGAQCPRGASGLLQCRAWWIGIGGFPHTLPEGGIAVSGSGLRCAVEGFLADRDWYTTWLNFLPVLPPPAGRQACSESSWRRRPPSEETASLPSQFNCRYTKSRLYHYSSLNRKLRSERRQRRQRHHPSPHHHQQISSAFISIVTAQ